MRIIGHGIDLIDIARVERLLARHRDRVLERCLTPAERAYALSARRLVEHVAARLAAKEAVFKALGTGWAQGIGWADAEVTRDPAGRPGIALHGRAAQVAADLGITNWHVSLTHTPTAAAASVIASG